MTVGIKYCGGCNPRYDRVQAVEALRREFPQHRFEPAGPGMDLLLVLCGCHVACAGTDGYAPRLGTLWVKDVGGLDAVRAELKRHV